MYFMLVHREQWLTWIYLRLSRPEETCCRDHRNQEIYSKRPQAIKAVRDNLKVKIASAFDLAEKQVT